MNDKHLSLIQAWIGLSGMLKNSRFTKELPYGESIVMLQLYQAGDAPLSIKQITESTRMITESTRMLKSQVNRTINSLEEKGLLFRCPGDGDRRLGYVRANPERMDIFLQVHRSSMAIADHISNIIGAEDTEHFIRIVNKLAQSGYHL